MVAQDVPIVGGALDDRVSAEVGAQPAVSRPLSGRAGRDSRRGHGEASGLGAFALPTLIVLLWAVPRRALRVRRCRGRASARGLADRRRRQVLAMRASAVRPPYETLLPHTPGSDRRARGRDRDPLLEALFEDAGLRPPGPLPSLSGLATFLGHAEAAARGSRHPGASASSRRRQGGPGDSGRGAPSVRGLSWFRPTMERRRPPSRRRSAGAYRRATVRTCVWNAILFYTRDPARRLGARPVKGQGSSRTPAAQPRPHPLDPPFAPPFRLRVDLLVDPGLVAPALPRSRSPGRGNRRPRAGRCPGPPSRL